MSEMCSGSIKMDIKRHSNWQLNRISRQIFAVRGILPGTAKNQIIKTVIEHIYLLLLYERVFLASVSWGGGEIIHVLVIQPYREFHNSDRQ